MFTPKITYVFPTALPSSSIDASELCSQILEVQDEDALNPYLESYAEQAVQYQITLDLTVDVRKTWYGTSVTLEKIEKAFQGIRSITFVGQFPQHDRYLEIPASVTKLVLKNIDFLPLASMCKKASQLQELRIYGSVQPKLLQEILTVPYPKTFERFEAQNMVLENRALFENPTNSVGHYLFARFGGVPKEKALAHLQKSLDLTPSF
ncbi:MAG: hypothetical protein JSR46_02200, partial [Verrucomicrobia bacterium]|nr:hypothetical protein [Verrucomicrobiota bacterium]